MLAVRYAVLTALAVWLGGMVVLGGIVAPAAFRVLQAADPQGGRVLAGVLFGDLLRQFNVVSYCCGAVVIVGLVVMKFVGPPPPAFPLRVGLSAAMLGCAVYAGVPVMRELNQIQSSVATPIQGLPDTDPRRIRFDTLHGTSTALMTINMGLGLLSLFWYTRE